MTADLVERPAQLVRRDQPPLPQPEPRPRRRRRIPVSAIIALGYLSGAIFVLWRLWGGLNSSLLLHNQDQAMMEWFFAFDAHALVNLENPFFTTLQNYPVGFNGMANTLLLGLGIPLAPVTLIFGATATFAVALTLGMAGTAFGWYWLFSRKLGLHQAAAVIGGALCGFGPAAISHAHGHVNFVFGVLLPLIVIRLLAAERSVRPIRDGVILGLLVSWQIFIGEEPLLLFVFGCALFGLGLLAFDRERALSWTRGALRPVSIGIATTIAISGVPIWWQFFGTQSYHALDHTKTSNDLAEFVQWPDRSVGNLLWSSERLSLNPTELSAYYGLLLVLVVAIVVAMWSRPLVRAAGVAIAVMCVLSLGSEVSIGGNETGIPLPWALLRELPPLGSAVELRFAGACLPLIAMIVAIAVDATLRNRNRDMRILGIGGLAVALVPLIPTPLEVMPRQVVPAFVTEQMWVDYVDDGSVVFVPLPDHTRGEPLRWHAAADFGFPIAGGYFVGPASNGVGSHDPDPRPTTELLRQVALTGQVPTITEADRLRFIEDLLYWDADVVVLPHTFMDLQFYKVMTDLFSSQGTYIGDVWVWRFDLEPV